MAEAIRSILDRDRLDDGPLGPAKLPVAVSNCDLAAATLRVGGLPTEGSGVAPDGLPRGLSSLPTSPAGQALSGPSARL
jgi:hypothetical protein